MIPDPVDMIEAASLRRQCALETIKYRSCGARHSLWLAPLEIVADPVSYPAPERYRRRHPGRHDAQDVHGPRRGLNDQVFDQVAVGADELRTDADAVAKGGWASRHRFTVGIGSRSGVN
jgi:hypothetical protein